MKTPPFLMFAALLFWGWQSNLLLVGAIMGIVLESSRFIRWRWELDDADFHRITSFCVVLNVTLVGYVFTTNGEGGGLSRLLHGNAVQSAVNSGVVTTIRVFRWLPMSMFLFIAAQMFNARPSVPLTAVSFALRWRRRKGDRAFTGHYVCISYPYFIVCLFSAGIHTNNGTQTYFWGLAFLTAWALWSRRSRRFGIGVWAGMFVVMVGLGFLGQLGINEAQRVIQNYNAVWMAKLFGNKTDVTQSMTSMGEIGLMKQSAKIVIRLVPESAGQVPTYLHEASYRTYNPRNRTWFAGGTVNDPFENMEVEADNSSWNLISGKRDAASVNIACYLDGRSQDGDPEGVLPLPSGCSRLENLPLYSSVIALQTNKLGAVLATGSGLMIFDARFGSGKSLDSMPDTGTNSLDMNVPPNETNAIDSVIAEMKISPTDDSQKKRLAVGKFFATNFTYSTWQGPDKLATTNMTVLTRFLLASRSGHCEYFATATVLVLRRLGIPARYAVGYAVHERSGRGYVVRERDAHAWCLAWNATTRTWDDFDTTPSSWVEIESARASFLDWLSDFSSWLGFQFEKFRYGQAHLRQYILWSLIPVLAVLLYHIIFRRRGKLRAKPGKKEIAAPAIWPGLDSEFYQLENKLAARGLPRQPGETLSDWLERALAEPALADLREPLRQLLRWHYRHRFDPKGLSIEERETLKIEAKACLDALLRTGKGK